MRLPSTVADRIEVVRRVIDGVGDAEQCVADQQEPVARQQGGDTDRDAAEDQAARQHDARADAVDHERLASCSSADMTL